MHPLIWLAMGIGGLFLGSRLLSDDSDDSNDSDHPDDGPTTVDIEEAEILYESPAKRHRDRGHDLPPPPADLFARGAKDPPPPPKSVPRGPMRQPEVPEQTWGERFPDVPDDDADILAEIEAAEEGTEDPFREESWAQRFPEDDDPVSQLGGDERVDQITETMLASQANPFRAPEQWASQLAMGWGELQPPVDLDVKASGDFIVIESFPHDESAGVRAVRIPLPGVDSPIAVSSTEEGLLEFRGSQDPEGVLARWVLFDADTEDLREANFKTPGRGVPRGPRS